jgi:hypothetical protein
LLKNGRRPAGPADLESPEKGYIYFDDFEKVVDSVAKSSMTIHQAVETIETGFTGFFGIYIGPANPEKVCISCLFADHVLPRHPQAAQNLLERRVVTFGLVLRRDGNEI